MFSVLDRLPRRLRRFFIANLVALSCVPVTLGALSLRMESRELRADAIVALVSWALLILGLPAIHRFGVRGAVYSVVVSSFTFAGVGVWFSPQLASAFQFILLLPLLIVLPHLPHREMAGITVAVLALASGIAILGAVHPPVFEPLPAIYAATSLGLAVPLILAVVVYELTQIYDEITARAADLRASRNDVVNVANATRRGLERDLHDGAQQHLVSMVVEIGRARVLLGPGTDPRVTTSLAELDRQAKDAITELRELVRGIYPQLLAERGLNAALAAAARRSTLPCTLLDEPIPRQSSAVEAAVYFCILEALQNAAKHSRATTVTVQLRAKPRLEFAVVDDGVGFDTDATPMTGGLLGMRARIVAVGGLLTVRSSPGRGTTVRGTLNLNASEQAEDRS